MEILDKVIEVGMEEKIKKEKKWAAVSPGKASRSPNSRQRELEFGQVSILTKSRFSVLTPADEGEIVENKSEKLEQQEVVNLMEKLKEKDDVIIP